MTSRSRRYRLLLVGATVLAVVGLLVLVRGALFPFILSAVLAYILSPVVAALESLMPWMDRWPGTRRVAAVLVVYVAAIAVLVAAVAVIVPPAFRQGSEFVSSVPELFADARAEVEKWTELYSERIPEDVRAQIESSLKGSSSVLIGAGQSVLARTVSSVTNTVTTVIGLAIVPFMLFYLLKDREVAVEGFYSLMPPDARRHTRNVIAIANQVIGSYIRGQLTLAVVVGAVAFLGLLALGIEFSVLLGIVAGLTELIPVIGPLLGAIPGVLVALATAPDKLLPVIALYVGIQMVENIVLVPRIQGQAVDIHPALIMVILVVGSEAAGLWGVIISVPLAAVARDVFKYFYTEWSAQPSMAA